MQVDVYMYHKYTNYVQPHKESLTSVLNISANYNSETWLNMIYLLNSYTGCKPDVVRKVFLYT